MLGAMFTLMIHVFSLFSEHFKSTIKVINILDLLENSTHAIKRVSLHRTLVSCHPYRSSIINVCGVLK